MLYLCLFVLSAILYSPSKAQAKWNLYHDRDSGQYFVHSNEVKVSTVRNNVAKTQMLVMFSCNPRDRDGGLALVFIDEPHFSNKDIIDVGTSRGFSVMLTLHRRDMDKPKFRQERVVQFKKTPKMLYLDTDLIDIMRKYELMSVGFGWKRRNHVDAVMAKVVLIGFGDLIDQAKRKCRI